MFMIPRAREEKQQWSCDPTVENPNTCVEVLFYFKKL